MIGRFVVYLRVVNRYLSILNTGSYRSVSSDTGSIIVAAIDVKVEGYEGIIEITEADIVSLRVTVLCPVVGSQVDGSTCCTICAVADREAKPTVLPEGIRWDAELQAKCLACEHRR